MAVLQFDVAGRGAWHCSKGSKMKGKFMPKDKPLPFQEGIVEVIRHIRLTEIPTVSFVICHMVIPVNHDAIITEIERCWDHFEHYRNDSARAKAHVLEQKRLAEEKAAKKVIEAAKKLQVIDAALAAAIVDDDDSATPPEIVADGRHRSIVTD